MLLFTAEMPPITSPLISTIVIEQKVEEPVKQITWKDNPQGCNENTHYIAAEEPFYCIVKPHTTYARKASVGAVNGSHATNGWYPVGQCTYYVASQRSVGQWNNATDWLWQAQRDGWATGSTPKVGAIAWQYGHVALVTGVSGDMVTVSEMNYVGWNVQSSRTVHKSVFTYIY